MDDQNLIRRIKAGDADAMDQLVQKYYGMVYAYCCRRPGNRDDAQDTAGIRRVNGNSTNSSVF